MSKFKELVNEISDLIDYFKLMGYRVKISDDQYGSVIYLTASRSGYAYIYISEKGDYVLRLNNNRVTESTIEGFKKKLIDLL